MKLSTLVAYRNLLKDYTPEGMHEIVKYHAGHSLYLVKEHELQFELLSNQLEENYNNINQAFNTYNNTIQHILTQIQTLINEQEPLYFESSISLYKESVANQTSKEIITQRLSLTPENKEFIEARIKPYSDWRYPGMIIRPGIESWIFHLVALDPMYLVDLDMDLINPTLKRFHDQYRNRLRTYTISENSDDGLLHRLPDHLFSFGLIRSSEPP